MVVITGAAGMTGTSLLSRMSKNHDFPHVRGIYYSRHPWVEFDNIEYFRADLRDPEQAGLALKNAHTVVICSVVTGGAAFLNNSFWNQISDNLMMYSNLLRICDEAGVKKIIFVGSASIYQEIDGPITETLLDRNIPPNLRHRGIALVMRFIEEIATLIHQESGTDVILLRCANIYGPGDRFKPEFSNVVPALIRKAFERQRPFEVWGRPDITRDIVYVDDIARLIEKIIQSSFSGITTINAGSNNALTIGELVSAVLTAAQYTDADIRYCDSKPTTVSRRFLDCSAAKKIFGWQAQISYQEGIAKTYQWWKNNNQWWDR